jgi:hypothetical protein
MMRDEEERKYERHRFSTLRDSMFGEFTRKDKTNAGLDLS